MDELIFLKYKFFIKKIGKYSSSNGKICNNLIYYTREVGANETTICIAKIQSMLLFLPWWQN